MVWSVDYDEVDDVDLGEELLQKARRVNSDAQKLTRALNALRSSCAESRIADAGDGVSSIHHNVGSASTTNADEEIGDDKKSRQDNAVAVDLEEAVGQKTSRVKSVAQELTRTLNALQFSCAERGEEYPQMSKSQSAS